MLYKNNKLKRSSPKRNDKTELPNGSYSALGVQDYFEYTIKKHETLAVILQCKYILTKLKIELHGKLRLDIILSF